MFPRIKGKPDVYQKSTDAEQDEAESPKDYYRTLNNLIIWQSNQSLEYQDGALSLKKKEQYKESKRKRQNRQNGIMAGRQLFTFFLLPFCCCKRN